MSDDDDDDDDDVAVEVFVLISWILVVEAAATSKLQRADSSWRNCAIDKATDFNRKYRRLD